MCVCTVSKRMVMRLLSFDAYTRLFQHFFSSFHFKIWEGNFRISHSPRFAYLCIHERAGCAFMHTVVRIPIARKQNEQTPTLIFSVCWNTQTYQNSSNSLFPSPIKNLLEADQGLHNVKFVLFESHFSLWCLFLSLSFHSSPLRRDQLIKSSDLRIIHIFQ